MKTYHQKIRSSTTRSSGEAQENRTENQLEQKNSVSVLQEFKCLFFGPMGARLLRCFGNSARPVARNTAPPRRQPWQMARLPWPVGIPRARSRQAAAVRKPHGFARFMRLLVDYGGCSIPVKPVNAKPGRHACRCMWQIVGKTWHDLNRMSVNINRLYQGQCGRWRGCKVRPYSGSCCCATDS